MLAISYCTIVRTPTINVLIESQERNKTGGFGKMHILGITWCVVILVVNFYNFLKPDLSVQGGPNLVCATKFGRVINVVTVFEVFLGCGWRGLNF